ncbi:hypothetical protein EMPS_01633 [Entomortierella parvispora]|uniref:Uncharacterized protein n=1 Tax=Entomortierella parvispora TaxID=205924 RepID=A0A9P3H3X9_9FUNG|nr:hypothetical protein EMPS_01633 [Entomortierella parvispora]
MTLCRALVLDVTTASASIKTSNSVASPVSYLIQFENESPIARLFREFTAINSILSSGLLPAYTVLFICSTYVLLNLLAGRPL